MKKIISVILCTAFLCFIAGCSKPVREVTEDDANEYLVSFFSSYTKMNEYLKNPDIAISAFALDFSGLSSVLKAVYQAESVTFTFSKPVKAQNNVFIANLEVTAPNIQPLYDMYMIDREFMGEDIPDDFVAQSFYDNIRSGTTTLLTSVVTVTVRYDGENGVWSVDPSNDLAFAIFPNIDKAN